MIISELEMKRVEALQRQTKELDDKLKALKAIQRQSEDWRVALLKYARSGKAVDGFQLMYQSPIFKDIPEYLKAGLVPESDLSDKAGWEYLKTLPRPRKMRKRLYKSRNWILNLLR